MTFLQYFFLFFTTTTRCSTRSENGAGGQCIPATTAKMRKHKILQIYLVYTSLPRRDFIVLEIVDVRQYLTPKQ